MIKRAVWVGFVSLIVFSQVTSAFAISVQAVPNPRQANGTWVADTANLLTPQTEAEINRIITQLEAKNGSEIAVVTVPDTKPSPSSKAFATSLFNTWKIGKQGKNNGVLFLISQRDRRTEIETGSGLTKILPDSKVEIILTQQVTPQYKQGKFNEGTLAGTLAIAQALGASPVQNNPPREFGVLLLAVGFLVYIISKIINWLKNLNPANINPREAHSHSRSSWNSETESYSSWHSSDTDSNSYHSGSSDSSSGSDFGGGSSDGGGSGDSW
jgi:uncharacterized protein